MLARGGSGRDPNVTQRWVTSGQQGSLMGSKCPALAAVFWVRPNRRKWPDRFPKPQVVRSNRTGGAGFHKGRVDGGRLALNYPPGERFFDLADGHAAP